MCAEVRPVSWRTCRVARRKPRIARRAVRGPARSSTVRRTLGLRSDQGAPHDAYFAGLNRALREHGTGRPTAVVDLDRVDRNCAALRASVAPGLALRVVAKSLPCPRLLAH